MVEPLTEKKIAELREAFEIFDRDKDGYITAKELIQVMKSLNQDPSEQEINEMIKQVDLDNNGRIDFNEFAELMTKRSKETDIEEEVINAFRVLDKQGQGTISTVELRHLMVTLGDKLTEEEVEEMLREADFDGNGIINYEEFVRMMMTK